MRIWIDADACPKIVKDILFRAALRSKTEIILVSNQFLNIPTSPFIQKILVPSGFDVADKKIIDSMEKGDLVITADIILADIVVQKGGTGLNPRGQLYTSENIKQHLSLRNFHTDLRSAGVMTGGPAGLNTKDVQAFADSLDAYLTRHKQR
jgi:uncharacterized protein YaiI (UPF0178 family)